jgi:hypothetical protein
MAGAGCQLPHLQLQCTIFAQQGFGLNTLAVVLIRSLCQQALAHFQVDLELHVLFPQ